MKNHLPAILHKALQAGKLKTKIKNQKYKKILIFLLTLTFIKGLVWLLIIPPFQAPDEQNHFAYVQFIGEMGRKPNPQKEANVSVELYKITEYLNFDWKGNHPMWQLEMRNLLKKHQKDIENIPIENRRQFLFIASGSKNPPFYYYLASLGYKVFYHQSIIQRLYGARLISLALSALVVLLTYLFISGIFKNKILGLTTSFIISFHPSFSFISATVTNDIFAIFSVTLLFYILTKTISARKRILRFIFLILTSILVIYAKGPQHEYLETLAFFISQIKTGHFFQSFWHYLFAQKNHFLANLFPWYWAVFGWLEITLPLWVYKIIKIICGLSFLGWGIKIAKQSKKPKKLKEKEISLIIVAGIAFFLIFAVFLFDWRRFVQSGSAFLIQARYFLPGISAHMFFLILGILWLVPKKWHNLTLKLLITGMILLNIFSLRTIINYFY